MVRPLQSAGSSVTTLAWGRPWSYPYPWEALCTKKVEKCALDGLVVRLVSQIVHQLPAFVVLFLINSSAFSCRKKEDFFRVMPDGYSPSFYIIITVSVCFEWIQKGFSQEGFRWTLKGEAILLPTYFTYSLCHFSSVKVYYCLNVSERQIEICKCIDWLEWLHILDLSKGI